MLLGDLDFNAAPAVHALQNLSEKIEHFEGKLNGLAASFGGYFVLFEAVMKVVEGFEGVLQMGAHLQALSTATGESVHDLTILGHALDITGGSADNAQNFIFKLQNAIAGVNEDGKSTAEALHLLGTSASELRSMPILEVTDRLQKGLAKIGEQSTKVAAIKDLLGFRFAATAMPLLANPEALETARKQAEPLANVMQDNAHAFHELEVAIKGAQISLTGFYAGALEGVAHDSKGIADAFASIDFVGIGRSVGSLLNIFLQFARVLEPIAKVLNNMADLLSRDSLIGQVGAMMGGFALGPLGAQIGGTLGDKLSPEGFGGEKEHHWSDAFRNIGDASMGGNSPISALQKIGGGGGFGGGDAYLNEARRANQLLERVANNTEPRAHNGSKGEAVPV